MKQDPFDRRLEAAHDRLEALAQQGRQLLPEYREVIDETVRKASAALEELQVTGKELQRQNEELLDLQNRLEREQRRYQALFEFAPEGYLVTDPKGVILEANQAAARLLNQRPENLTEKPLLSYIAPWDRDTFYTHLERMVQDEGRGYSASEGGRGCSARSTEWELHLLPRHDEPFPVAITLAPEVGGDGQVIGLRWLLREVRASKRAEERERLLAEVALERARFEAVIENAPEGIVVADREGRILLTNPSADAIYSRPVPYGQEYTSHADLRLCRPDGTPYDPRDLPLTRSALDGETLVEQELSIVWPDGQHRDLLANSAPIRDALGEVVGAVAVFQDITERKQVRQELHRYAERLRILHRIDAAILAAGSVEEIASAALPGVCELLPCAWAGLIILDAGPQVGEGEALLLAAGAGAEIVPLESCGPLEALRQGQVSIVDDLQDSLGLLAGDLRNRGVRSLIRLPLAIGSEFIGTLNMGLAGAASPAGRLDGEQLEIAREVADQLAIGLRQALLRDEVERYTRGLEKSVARRTAALQASEARFRTIFEEAALGIALVDREERILASNPALQEMLGYSAEELQGRTFLDLTHPDDVSDSRELYRELFGGKLREYQLEKRYLHKDGRTVWVRPSVSLVRAPDSNGKRHAVKMVENITEQKRAQEALIQAEKLTIAGQLGASLAHEINNPLQSVIGCLGLAEESLAEAREYSGEGDVLLTVDRYLSVAREELQRAARIVARLRDLHRHSDPEEREPTDLVALLDEVLLLLGKQLESHGVEVIWKRPDWLPPLSLVADRIRQVFLNLALNAIDALPDGGQLRVEATGTEEAEGTPSGVRVSFTDNGLGIGAEGRERLFDPFYTTKPEGLGLGLYISQRIVREHGGKIQADSQPDEGTRVSVWLPLSA
jgi:PAS domain S-box-containing protein